MSRRPARSPSRPIPSTPFPISTGLAQFTDDPDDDDGVFLLINGVESSHLYRHQPERLCFEYMQWMAAAITGLVPSHTPIRVLHLGAAGCSMAAYIEATRPNSRQLAIEVDAELARVVRDILPLPRAPQLRLRVTDARAAVTAMPDAQWDIVIRDAFADSHTPQELTTVEFLSEVSRVLRPDGTYLMNCADSSLLRELRSDVATAHGTFEHVDVISEPAIMKGRRIGNFVIVASHTQQLPTTGPDGIDRALLTLSPPAQIMRADALRRLIAGTPPRTDSATNTTTLR